MGSVRSDTTQINPDACTPEDQQQNWQNLNQILQQITNLLQGGGGGDTYKVGVDATDVSNATPDFLHAKINDHGTFNDPTSVVVASATIGHLTEQFFWDAQTITGYEANKVLTTDGDGALLWGDTSAETDTFKVLVSASDTTPSYLILALSDNATYASGADVVIGSAVVGAPSTDQTCKLFVDVSAMTGYADTGSFVWMTIDNATQLVDVGTAAFGDTYKVLSTATDTTPAYLHDAVNHNATLVSSEDGIVACQTIGGSSTNQKEEFFLDSSGISGYGDITDGQTRPLSLSRSGSTYTLKWAGTTILEFFRIKTTTGISEATGYSLAAAGTGTAVTANDDGTFGLGFTIANGYADEVPANTPGWGINLLGQKWLINAGCSTMS